ncbi:uncharacterized protein BDZ99DRAFT_60682 [Mytilinidion resinicola]|uniref:Heterokaryon incompatibility domain-containing protein n=1 Tax=Mytilinidion resinicola TaxID=574789 RepID=A0A6A6YFJ9_9PEZI|nr:uncharacterized protein BDZ99DRAFT_60682 [Mytilinidion resinicola]KAF2807572.1 hypothetical protein BDZ99DRAFT_60682 [Mytilinidion resinicola]
MAFRKAFFAFLLISSYLRWTRMHHSCLSLPYRGSSLISMATIREIRGGIYSGSDTIQMSQKLAFWERIIMPIVSLTSSASKRYSAFFLSLDRDVGHLGDISPQMAVDDLAMSSKTLQHITIHVFADTPASFAHFECLRVLDVDSSCLINWVENPPNRELVGQALAQRLPRSLEQLWFRPWSTFVQLINYPTMLLGPIGDSFGLSITL